MKGLSVPSIQFNISFCRYVTFGNNSNHLACENGYLMGYDSNGPNSIILFFVIEQINAPFDANVFFRLCQCSSIEGVA